MALVTLVTLVAALSPGAPMHSSNQAQPAISRRNFLPLGAAAGLSLAAMPAFAEDDAIAAIAARANAKAAAEREAKKPQPVREAGEGADLVSIHKCLATARKTEPYHLSGRSQPQASASGRLTLCRHQCRAA
eukprot:scaffold118896_cov27-Tisochrysis_lutea.AAC.2